MPRGERRVKLQRDHGQVAALLDLVAVLIVGCNEEGWQVRRRGRGAHHRLDGRVEHELAPGSDWVGRDQEWDGVLGVVVPPRATIDGQAAKVCGHVDLVDPADESENLQLVHSLVAVPREDAP